MESRARLALLASHEGTTAQAILDACESGSLPAKVVVLISNNSDCGAGRRAEAAGAPFVHLSRRTHPDPDELDRAMLDALRRHEAQWVALAGFMRPVGPRVIAAYPGRVLNTHPALLPRHGGAGMYGRRVHETVLQAGEPVTGVTIHRVDEHYDHGPIVAQAEVPVERDDTVDSLAERVKAAEKRLYVATLRSLLSHDS